MCGVVRIKQQDAAAHSTQDQSRGKAGRAPADYRDIEATH
jgi:hypothetical protein